MPSSLRHRQSLIDGPSWYFLMASAAPGMRIHIFVARSQVTGWWLWPPIIATVVRLYLSTTHRKKKKK